MRKIGILTSGGDAPGMNAAIKAVTISSINKGYEVYVIYDGYRGLLEKNIVRIDKNFVEEIDSRGGTIIRSARLKEFKEEKVQDKAVKILNEFGIDALVVIGGDGSYMGAQKLSLKGILCVCLPGTIDNDIASSDFTIGFDTSLNTIVKAIDQIKDTGRSHSRCMVVEVMGNKCDDLAIYSGIACGADIVISRNHPMTDKEILDILNKKKEEGKISTLVIVSEKLFDLNSLLNTIEKGTTWEVRSSILGHIQRGGTPTAMERVNAKRMGYFAVNLIEKNITGVCVGLDKNKIVYRDILEALKIKTETKEELLDVVSHIN